MAGKELYASHAKHTHALLNRFQLRAGNRVGLSNETPGSICFWNCFLLCTQYQARAQSLKQVYPVKATETGKGVGKVTQNGCRGVNDFRTLRPLLWTLE